DHGFSRRPALGEVLERLRSLRESRGDVRSEGCACQSTGLAVAAPIRWLEVVSGAEDPGRPLAQTTVHAWQAAGHEATLHLAAGGPFWSSQKIQDSRDMTDIVVRIFGESHS